MELDQHYHTARVLYHHTFTITFHINFHHLITQLYMLESVSALKEREKTCQQCRN